MKDFIGSLIGLALLLMLGLLSLADASEPISLRQVDLTYRNYFDGSRNLMLPNNTLGEGVNLGVSIDLLKYFFFNNVIHSYVDRSQDGSPGQFRAVGWEYNLGFDLGRIISSVPLSVSLYHYSQHSLDSQLPFTFPQETGIEFKLIIYRR